jgi:divalent metal cation (Fe/Co/Zn/Cd) transporter
MIVNTVVNVLLVAAKAVAVLYSSSISLTASLVDSVLDLLSTFIILATSWAIGLKTDRHMVSLELRQTVTPIIGLSMGLKRVTS